MRIDQDIDIFSSPAIREALARAVRTSGGPFTIDLRAVRYIDSVGLGLLVYVKHMLGEDGRNLRLLVAPESPVERILEISGLHAVLGTVAEVEPPRV